MTEEEKRHNTVVGCKSMGVVLVASARTLAARDKMPPSGAKSFPMVEDLSTTPVFNLNKRQHRKH